MSDHHDTTSIAYHQGEGIRLTAGDVFRHGSDSIKALDPRGEITASTGTDAGTVRETIVGQHIIGMRTGSVGEGVAPFQRDLVAGACATTSASGRLTSDGTTIEAKVCTSDIRQGEGRKSVFGFTLG